MYACSETAAFHIEHSTSVLSKFAQREPLIRRFAAPSPRRRGEGLSRWECRVPLAPRSGERVAEGRVRGSCILLKVSLSFADLIWTDLTQHSIFPSPFSRAGILNVECMRAVRPPHSTLNIQHST